MKKYKQYIVIELDEGSIMSEESWPPVKLGVKTFIETMTSMNISSIKNGKRRMLSIEGLEGRNIEILTKEIETEN